MTLAAVAGLVASRTVLQPVYWPLLQEDVRRTRRPRRMQLIQDARRLGLCRKYMTLYTTT